MRVKFNGEISKLMDLIGVVLQGILIVGIEYVEHRTEQ